MKEYLIQFGSCKKDLRHFQEFWMSCSYEEYFKNVVDAIVARKGIPPSKNMRFIRIGTFAIKKSTTMEELQHLSDLIRHIFGIDCFQIAIERPKKKVHVAFMLFGWYDETKGKTIKMSSTEMFKISALILHELELPTPSDMSPTFYRYLIRNLYRENRNCFKELLEVCRSKGLTRSQHTLLRESMNYLEMMCMNVVR